jgi:hypothetical protein
MEVAHTRCCSGDNEQLVLRYACYFSTWFSAEVLDIDGTHLHATEQYDRVILVSPYPELFDKLDPSSKSAARARLQHFGSLMAYQLDADTHELALAAV